MLCCCTLVIAQCSLLRQNEEVSFVLPMKLCFVDSEASFYWRYLTRLKNSSEWALLGQRRLCVPAQGKA